MRAAAPILILRYDRLVAALTVGRLTLVPTNVAPLNATALAMSVLVFSPQRQLGD